MGLLVVDFEFQHVKDPFAMQSLDFLTEWMSRGSGLWASVAVASMLNGPCCGLYQANLWSRVMIRDTTKCTYRDTANAFLSESLHGKLCLNGIADSTHFTSQTIFPY